MFGREDSARAAAAVRIAPAKAARMSWRNMVCGGGGWLDAGASSIASRAREGHMETGYRRYEILLPLKFNDGRAVPENLLADTLLEIEQKIGPLSFESQEIMGVWQHNG